MEIRQNGENELVVVGNIKSIDDSMAVRSALEKIHLGGSSGITLRITDSFAMPSAVIGYLMKLVNRDKVRLSVLVGDSRLKELLDELQLTDMFNVTSI